MRRNPRKAVPALCNLHCQLASTPGRESKLAGEGRRDICVFELLEEFLNYGSSHFLLFFPQ